MSCSSDSCSTPASDPQLSVDVSTASMELYESDFDDWQSDSSSSCFADNWGRFAGGVGCADCRRSARGFAGLINRIPPAATTVTTFSFFDGGCDSFGGGCIVNRRAFPSCPQTKWFAEMRKSLSYWDSTICSRSNGTPDVCRNCGFFALRQLLFFARRHNYERRQLAVGLKISVGPN